MLLKEIFPGVYFTKIKKRKILVTKNLCPGFSVYGERLIKIGNEEYREWIPKRSKLAAAIYKGLKTFPFKEDSIILYLGIASSTTASHISDICYKGLIFGLDISARVLRESVFVAKYHKNILPILEDANKIDNFKYLVGKVDIIYQDIAQRDQAKIFLKNIKTFLKKGGFGFLAVKARSIDVKEKPKKIFERVKKELEKEVEVIEQVRLDPFQKDHMMYIIRKI